MGCAAGKDAGRPANVEQKPVEDKKRKDKPADKEKEKEKQKDTTPVKARGVETPKAVEKQEPPPAKEAEPVEAKQSPPPAEKKEEVVAEVVVEEAPQEDKPKELGTLRGHPLSQPARSAQWYIARSRKPVKIVEVDLLSGEHRTPNYLAKHPYGQVPAYEEGDFNLSEGSAIIQYLAREDADLKPADVKDEIRLAEFIGKYYSNVRKFTIELFRSVMMSGSAEDFKEKAKAGLEKVKPILESFEQSLSTHAYVIGDSFTIADLLFAPEVQQLEWIEGVLDGFDSIRKYIEKMRCEDCTFDDNCNAAKEIFDKVRAFKTAEANGASNEQPSPQPEEAAKPETTPEQDQPEGKPVLKTFPLSQPSRTVMWFAKHVGKDIDVQTVNLLAGEQKSAEFLAKHPYGEVPVYEEGEFYLSEGAAILQHLSKGEEKFAQPDEKGEIRVQEYVGKHYSEVRKFTLEAFRKILFAKTKAEAEDASAKSYEVIKPTLERYNELLAKQDFVLGNALSLGDFLFVPEVDQLLPLGLLEAHPKITAYLERLREAYPEYKEQYEAAAKMIEEFRAKQA